MKEYDFRGVLGSTPEDYKANVQKTLNRLNDRDMRMGNLSMRVLLIAAIVALLAGTALALTNRISVLDMREGALPEAREAVVDIPESAAFESPLVRYRLIDAMADHGKVLLAIEAMPVDPEKYMIFNGWGEERKYDEAQSLGKKLVASEVSFRINGQVAIILKTEEQINENVMTVSMEYVLPDGSAADSLTITAFGYDHEVISPLLQHWDEAERHLDRPGIYGEEYETQSSVELRLKDLSAEALRFDGPFALEYITIDWVEFSRSPASLSMKLQYSLKADLPDGIKEELAFMSVSLMDPSGEKGEYASSSWVSYPVGSSLNNNWEIDEGKIVKDAFIEESTWPAIAVWPEKLVLRAYYKGLGEWSEPVEILIPQPMADDMPSSSP